MEKRGGRKRTDARHNYLVVIFEGENKRLGKNIKRQVFYKNAQSNKASRKFHMKTFF